MYFSCQPQSVTSLMAVELALPAQDSVEVFTRSLAEVIFLPARPERLKRRYAVSVPARSDWMVVEAPPAVEVGFDLRTTVSATGFSVTEPVIAGLTGWVVGVGAGAVVVGAGAGAGSRVTAYLGKNIGPAGTPPEAFAFDAFPGFAGGVFVG